MPKSSKLLLAMAVMVAAMLGVGGLSTAEARADDGGWEPVPSHQHAESDQGWILIQASQGIVDEIVGLKKQIRINRKATWRWQDTALVPRTKTAYQERQSNDVEYLRWMAKLWKSRLDKAWRYAQNPPHKALWLCIHSGEASWKDHASHNPHYGGLQMSLWFMSTYAPQVLVRHGTADHWHPLQQMWVAERAYQQEHYSRSWLMGQWGATAPPCI